MNRQILNLYRENEEQKQILETLRKAVNIDSPTTYESGITEIGNLFQEFLANIGFQTTKLSGKQYGDHVHGQYGEGGPAILLMGHMDTVFPQGTVKERPFTIDRSKGRAYGPGILDMKSGIVIMLHSLKLFLESRPQIQGTIHVLLNADEEQGSPESREYLWDILNGIKWSFVFEQGTPRNELVLKRKGEGIYTLTTRGKSSHSGSEPEVGANAIDELMHHLLEIEELADPPRGTTVNVGTIEGGEEPSIVPDYGKAQIDFRVETKAEQLRIEEKIHKLVEKNYVKGTKTNLKGDFHRPPMEPVEGTQDLQDIFESVIDTLGVETSFANHPRGEASDGNCIVDAGVPCVDGLGAIGRGAHGEDEYIEVSSLFTRTNLFANVLNEVF
ncbi:M20 family metallopeptidase [Candidatus Bipolaricaulota bacterium]|nr:M20 family metallopeptidase [Candidatus Bipolaricaulota bacterium]MBS3792109.1 M20 family metallopeptidase [Candidatus Bipolaricaulota bacterium]